MATYQGWANYATWGVALVLQNDEGAHSHFDERGKELRRRAPAREQSYWTEDEFVKFALADEIKDYVESITTEREFSGAEVSRLMIAQCLQAALSEVDWHEIVEGYARS